MNKIIIPILLLSLVVIVSGCVQPTLTKDPKCSEEPSYCDMLGAGGYFANTGECKYVPACGSPFKTAEECQQVCTTKEECEKTGSLWDAKENRCIFVTVPERDVCGLRSCPTPSSRCEWRNILDQPLCPGIVYPENICLQFLDCKVEGSSCNTVEDPKYQECMDCFKTGDIGGCQQKYSTSSKDSRCTSFNPEGSQCITQDMIEPGYYFDTKTNQCKYTVAPGTTPNNPCAAPPFATVEQCQQVCGSSSILKPTTLSTYPFDEKPTSDNPNCGEDTYKADAKINSVDEVVAFLKTHTFVDSSGNDNLRLDNFRLWEGEFDASGIGGSAPEGLRESEVDWNKVKNSVSGETVNGKTVYSLKFNPYSCKEYTLKVTEEGYVSVYGCCGI